MRELINCAAGRRYLAVRDPDGEVWTYRVEGNPEGPFNSMEQAASTVTKREQWKARNKPPEPFRGAA